MAMYSASTLNGIGGWMPNLKIRKAMTRTRTAWRNLPRGCAIALGLGRGRRRGGRRRRRGRPASLEGHQEGHQVDVLLRGEHLPEHRRHDPGREPRDGPLGPRVEDLPHDVLDGLGAP